MKGRKTTVVTIKNFPSELHREIKIQAAVQGSTIKELILMAIAEYLGRKGARK